MRVLLLTTYISPRSRRVADGVSRPFHPREVMSSAATGQQGCLRSLITPGRKIKAGRPGRTSVAINSNSRCQCALPRYQASTNNTIRPLVIIDNALCVRSGELPTTKTPPLVHKEWQPRARTRVTAPARNCSSVERNRSEAAPCKDSPPSIVPDSIAHSGLFPTVNRHPAHSCILHGDNRAPFGCAM